MLSLIIFLIVIGIVLILLEFLVIPGATIAAIGGFLLIGSGVYLTYTNFGLASGHIVLFSSVALMVVAVVFSLRSNTWKNAMLNKNIEGVANTYEMDKIKVGDIGKTISRLAPMGKVIINDSIFEAKTLSEFVDQNTKIEILKINSNIIIVKPLN